jgi:hypothetical protein
LYWRRALDTFQFSSIVEVRLAPGYSTTEKKNGKEKTKKRIRIFIWYGSPNFLSYLYYFHESWQINSKYFETKLQAKYDSAEN